MQEIAAKSALSITNADLKVVEELLSTENEILVSIVLAEIIAQNDKQIISEFLKRKKYLYSNNAGLRMRVLAFYIFENDSANLYELLNEYTSAETYYYDVVCYLDRILYAPVQLQIAYRKSLMNMFFDFLTFEDSYLKIVEEKQNRKKMLDDLIEKIHHS